MFVSGLGADPGDRLLRPTSSGFVRGSDLAHFCAFSQQFRIDWLLPVMTLGARPLTSFAVLGERPGGRPLTVAVLRRGRGPLLLGV